MRPGLISKLTAIVALGALIATPVHADTLEQQFDKAMGAQARAARTPTINPLVAKVAPSRPLGATVRPFIASAAPARYSSKFETEVAALAGHEQGRIGVAAIDLASGRTVSVLGDQPFPMASTSKIAIVAAYLEMVDQGRRSLDDRFPLLVPQRSARFSSAAAPVREGTVMSARYLIDRTIINSDNMATDTLLAAVGGPRAVNDWVRRAGITGFRLDRDIATLVRDDGEYNPATMIDQRDSATPLAMVKLLSGLHQGQWLSRESRNVLMSAMERCATGKRRIRGQLPEDALVAHKTGTLNNTSSDVGFIQAPDGRTIAVAIYVTGQGGKINRDARIAAIARTLYDGYQIEASSLRRSASR